MSNLDVRSLSVQPLEATAFHPFGAVIAPETADSPSLNRSPGNLGFLWVHKELEFPKAAHMCSLRYYYRGNRCEFLQKTSGKHRHAHPRQGRERHRGRPG